MNAAEQVLRLEEAIKVNAGVTSITTPDGGSVAFNREQLLAEHAYWKRVAAAESRMTSPNRRKTLGRRIDISGAF